MKTTNSNNEWTLDSKHCKRLRPMYLRGSFEHRVLTTKLKKKSSGQVYNANISIQVSSLFRQLMPLQDETKKLLI